MSDAVWPWVFVGTHSKIQINLNHVVMVEGNYEDSRLTVTFVSGRSISLHEQDSRMFDEAWNKHVRCYP